MSTYIHGSGEGRIRLACRWRFLLLLIPLVWIPSRAPAQISDLLISDLGDQSEIGRDRDDESGFRYWSWSWGGLVVLDADLPVEEMPSALKLICGPALRGMSDGRRLKIKDGQYKIKSALLLSDPAFQLFIDSGTLIIDGSTIRIVHQGSRDHRADMMLFLGLLLLTAVLLRNARRRSGRR